MLVKLNNDVFIQKLFKSCFYAGLRRDFQKDKNALTVTLIGWGHAVKCNYELLFFDADERRSNGL